MSQAIRVAAAVLVISLAALAGPSQPLLGPVSGTAALYLLDEGSGTSVANSSGAAAAGTLTGGTAWVAGLGGSAVDFSGPLARLDVNVSVGSTWTIQGWARFPLASSGTGWWSFAENGPHYHHVIINRGSGVIGVYNTSHYPASDPATYPSGFDTRTLEGWHLISAVAASGQTKFYIDGGYVGAAGSLISHPVQAIGNHNISEAPFNFGVIDGMRILTVARSAADIAADAAVIKTPPAPVGALQERSTGAALDVGAATHDGVVVKAHVTDWLQRGVRLDVELQPLGSAFTGLPADIDSSPLVASGGTASLPLDGVQPGLSYHWRARTRSSDGEVSAWVSFGGNAETEADFVTSINQPPLAVPAIQKSASDGSDLGAGEIQFGQGVILQATPVDPDGDRVRQEFEIRAFGIPFSDEATVSSGLEASGETILLAVDLAPGSYHWQGRSVDEGGAASAWTAYGGGDYDFRLIANGSSNPSACSGGTAAGWTPLLLLVLLPLIRR